MSQSTGSTVLPQAIAKRTFWQDWCAFWFTPQSPHTLAVIRIATGAMLFYMHLVWALDLAGFLGPNAWITKEVNRQFHAGDYTWTYLNYIDSISLLWIHQGVMLVIAACVMLGFLTRVTLPLAWFANLMYCHRLTAHLFGLDQVVMMLLMYLMLAPSGSVYSLDRRWFAGRHSFWFPISRPTSATMVATRLIQIHLCIIYLFGGVSKLRGENWWEGSAMWYALVNWEYQSMDMTWVGKYPWLIATLTHVTIFWETFYCAIVWPRWTRPVALGMAVMVHGGIAMSLGMITFGTMMIVANVSFISPETIQRWLRRK